MIGGLLALLEQEPGARLTEADMLAISQLDLDAMRSCGAIHQVELPGGAINHVIDGEHCAVVRDGDRYLALTAGDGEPELVEVDERELGRWSIDLPTLCRCLQRTNGLNGEIEPVTRRLWFLGQRDRRAYLLALYSDPEQLEIESNLLRGRFPDAAESFVLVLPSLDLPPTMLGRLQDRDVGVGRLDDITPFVISTEEVSSRPLGDGTSHRLFSASPDYTSVTLGSIPFTLTPRQAAVVAILHAAHRARRPELSWHQVKEQLKSHAPSFHAERMNDVFKGVANWERLIVRTRKGFYRLGI